MKYIAGDNMKMEIIELSKRVLEHKNISINIDEQISHEINANLSLINEKVPSLIINVDINTEEKNSIEFIHANQLFAYIGNKEPERYEILWIRDISSRDWKTIVNTITVLSEAGYPGCQNCLGPKYEYLWDERNNRKKYSQMK